MSDIISRVARAAGQTGFDCFSFLGTADKDLAERDAGGGGVDHHQKLTIVYQKIWRLLILLSACGPLKQLCDLKLSKGTFQL